MTIKHNPRENKKHPGKSIRLPASHAPICRTLTGLISTVSLLLIFTSFEAAPTQNKANGISMVNIYFTHFVGKKPFIPDSTYINPFGEKYQIQRLKYYITNIEFLNTNNHSKKSFENSYFLIDENNPASKKISLEGLEGNYNAISFLLGVDSLHNVSGAQTGALDPLNGMFWTWNSGYVSLKIEGRSPASSLPAKSIEYHLGGYKGTDKVIRRITLSFPQGLAKMTPGKTITIFVKLDVNLLFNGIHKLPIKSNAACTTPGSLARQYAENYARMFSISNVINK
ncbi:MAG TPA: MbnP family protein [Chitinophagaceae bacterium]|jgi:hypothetical protein|nr:MbnP family protein [Chitinophagaceae bacterium]